MFISHSFNLVLCILLDTVVPTYITPYVSYLLADTEIDIMTHLAHFHILSWTVRTSTICSAFTSTLLRIFDPVPFRPQAERKVK